MTTLVAGTHYDLTPVPGPTQVFQVRCKVCAVVFKRDGGSLSALDALEEHWEENHKEMLR